MRAPHTALYSNDDVYRISFVFFSGNSDSLRGMFLALRTACAAAVCEKSAARNDGLTSQCGVRWSGNQGRRREMQVEKSRPNAFLPSSARGITETSRERIMQSSSTDDLEHDRYATVAVVNKAMKLCDLCYKILQSAFDRLTGSSLPRLLHQLRFRNADRQDPHPSSFLRVFLVHNQNSGLQHKMQML